MPFVMMPAPVDSQGTQTRPQMLLEGFFLGLAASFAVGFAILAKRMYDGMKNSGDSVQGDAIPRRAGVPAMVAAGAGRSVALPVGAAKIHSASRVSRIVMTIGDQLATIEGPDLYWGDQGPLQNPPLEENEFKEYDTYSTFLAACAQHGVDLSQPDITVFAPGNKACKEYSAVNGPLTKDICMYHVVKGVVNSDSLSSADLTTLQGSKITYRRMFRKHFVDNAFCAAMASPPRTSYKGDIKASNGLIHMINEVIYPGWSESAGMEATR